MDVVKFDPVIVNANNPREFLQTKMQIESK